MRLSIFTIAFFFVVQFSYGQKYSNEFLSIGVGARAQGMGSAVIASSSDVFSLFWNPAGLAAIESPNLQLGAMHSEWFAGIGKHDVFAASIPMQSRNSRLALGFVRFGIDGIPNTLSLYNDDGSINYDNIQEFSAADFAFFAGFGTEKEKWGGKLYLGSSAKIVRRVIGQFANSWGFGLDVGSQFHKRNWKTGLMLRDISTTVNSWSVNFSDEDKAILEATGNSLPDIRSTEITKPSVLFNTGRVFNFKKFTLYPEVGFTVTTDGQRNSLISGDPLSMDLNIGLELFYNEFIYLRAGVNQFQYIQNFDDTESLIMKPGLGTGMKLGNFEIDYAFTNLVTNNALYSHIISLKLNMKDKN